MRAKAAEHAHSRQTAALFLLGAMDLSVVLDAPPQERHKAACRISRLIERERQRGIRRHWSYDLNRHIALKQALDRLLQHTA